MDKLVLRRVPCWK